MASDHALAKNGLWNFIGSAAPMAVGLFSIPMLIGHLGTERFGLLTMIWILIGYFSLFDLGLGRALTKLVAERIGRGDEPKQSIPAVVGTALVVMGALGFVGSLTLVSIGPWLATSALRISPSLQSETVASFIPIALTIPSVILFAGFKGVLEAYQRFAEVNWVRLPLGILIFVVPLCTIPLTTNLSVIAWMLLVVRFTAMFAMLLFCRSVLRLTVGDKLRFSGACLKQLFGYGLWMTVSNIVGPLMVYLDRFIIGSLISATAVAYYTTPYEIVTRLWILPTALVGVLFPAVATSLVQDRHHAARLYGKATNYIVLTLFPVCLIIVFFAHEALSWWLNPDFANQSAFVLKVLALGVFFNSLAQTPFSILQGAGQPDWTAKVHLLETPLYLLLLWQLLHHYGINGVALAWTLRIALDTVIMFYLAGRILPESGQVLTQTALNCILALFAFAPGFMLNSLLLKISYTCVMIFVHVVYAWNKLLENDEKVILVSRLRAIARIA